MLDQFSHFVACLGETLARANFFLALTAVMQRFQISFDPDTEITDNTVESAILL